MVDKFLLIDGSSRGVGRTVAEGIGQRGYGVMATVRDCSGRNYSTSQALRSLAESEGWNLDVLDMDVTSDGVSPRELTLDRPGSFDLIQECRSRGDRLLDSRHALLQVRAWSYLGGISRDCLSLAHVYSGRKAARSGVG
jgi:NAD(P)-dependent dehydrogenase (short-subunit alcohol dehydrogenase family)